MSTVLARAASEAFFLYAETYLPDATTRAETLSALAQCAAGTARATPQVATYVFRPSQLAGVIAQSLYPGSLALESTELYLTHEAFRHHLTTDEFRAGLRAMYKGTRRLGARIFWIGPRPPADIVNNIFRSDPQARPIAPIVSRIFNATAFVRASNEDLAIVSVLCPVASGRGAAAIEAVDIIDASLESISMVAFFHPLATDLLRIFLILPIDGKQPAQLVAQALQLLSPVTDPDRRMMGLCQTHRTRVDLAAQLRESLADPAIDWEIRCDGYAGHVSHPGALASN
jgi:hypothetical protein